MSSDEKVAEIFRELAGSRAERLAGNHYLADVSSRITTAFASAKDNEIAIHNDIGFHLVDWQSDAAFLVALSLYPERFTDEEIREGVVAFLIHAPSHVAEAARLADVPITSFSANNPKEDSE